MISESDEGKQRVSQGSFLLVFYFDAQNDDQLFLKDEVGQSKMFIVQPRDGKLLQHPCFLEAY